MIKRALVLLSLAAIYIWVTRQRGTRTARQRDDHAAEADWANEGGRNAPPSV